MMEERKYVVFSLADELYGLPIESVERILADQATTRIPRTAKMMLGVFELRGETIAAIDLRERFEFPAYEAQGNMVVVLTEGGRVAFRVDGVDGIHTFDESTIDDSPGSVKKADDDFMAAIGKHEGRLVVLLDPDHVLPKKLEGSVKKAAKSKPELAAA